MKVIPTSTRVTVAATPITARSEALSAATGTRALSLIPLWVATLFILAFMFVVVWRPFGDNAVLHNITILLSLFFGCGALVVAATQIETIADWALFAGHILIVGFLLRCISVLVLPYPPLFDGYFYFTTLLNIVEGNTLEPVYRLWYGGTRQQLNWPILQLITAQMHVWTGTSVEELFRFLPPAIGSLTFVIVSLVAFKALPDWRFASLAGLLGSTGDLVLYYQNEYHPQGLAVVYFMFLLLMLMYAGQIQRLGARLILLIVVATFAFSHHGSSLGLPLTLAPLVFLPVVAGRFNGGIQGVLRRLSIPEIVSPRVFEAILLIKSFRGMILLIITVCVTVHLYIFSDILAFMTRDFLATATGDISGVPSHLETRAVPPWWIIALRWAKYPLLLLSLMGFVFALRRPSTEKLLLIIPTAVLMVVSLAGSSGTTRFLAFWYCLAAITAAWGLVLITKNWTGNLLLRAIIVFGMCVYMLVGVVNQQIPAFVFEQLPRNVSVRYGNALPRTDRMALVGRWVANKTPESSRYATDFSTHIGLFFFGRIDDQAFINVGSAPVDFCYADYYIVDYELSDGGFLGNRIPIDVSHVPRVYDNGSMEVRAQHAPAECRARVEVIEQ